MKQGWEPADARRAEAAEAVGSDNRAQASLNLLSGAERARFTELAIFADDTAIPGDLLCLLWAATGAMSGAEVHRLCGKLADLSLVSRLARDNGSVQLHDTLRAYLRSAADPQKIRTLNRRPAAAHADRQDGRPRLSNHWLPPDLDSSLRLTLAGHTEWVLRVAVSPDGRRIASSDFHEVRVWDAHSGSHKTCCPWVFVRALAFSADGSLIMGYHSFSPNRLEIVDIATGDHVRGWDADPCSAVAFSADGRWLVCADGGRVQIRDTVSGQQVLSFTTDCSPVSSITISPDRTWIASGSDDGSVAIWDAATRAKPRNARQ